MGIRGLKLDDLELASLRGNLQDVSLDLNFGSREGRGEINMRCPRYVVVCSMQSLMKKLNVHWECVFGYP